MIFPRKTTSGDFDATELYRLMFHRDPSETESRYWDSELRRRPLRDILRQLSQEPDHRRFTKDNGLMFVEAGHFYSPIVDSTFVEKRHEWVFRDRANVPGIDERDWAQVAFLPVIKEIAGRLPFSAGKSSARRYFYDNGAFPFVDGVIYATMLLHHRPKRVVEIGCGYSSVLALDVAEFESDWSPEFRFYDPHPELLRSLGGDTSPSAKILDTFIQDVPASEFDDLEAGDIYFMDTTHIVKTGSDVLHHFEEIIPRLKSGVIIHLHDIFCGFEYPKSWVLDLKLSWNEIYYVKAFLTDNPKFEILFHNDYMHRVNPGLMAEASPILQQHSGGSLWFRKL